MPNKARMKKVRAIVLKVNSAARGENREKESGYRSEPEIHRAPESNESRDKEDDGVKVRTKNIPFHFVLKNFKRHMIVPFAFLGDSARAKTIIPANKEFFS
jgi:hypothetical protein